jgi:hypothetical protein
VHLAGTHFGQQRGSRGIIEIGSEQTDGNPQAVSLYIIA